MLVCSCHVPFRKQVLQIFAKLCSVFHVAMEFLKPIASLQEGDMRSEIASYLVKHETEDAQNVQRNHTRTTYCKIMIPQRGGMEGGGGGGGNP